MVGSKTELITGAILTGFGIFVIIQAIRLPYTSEFGPGPGFFPLWIGIGILACALCVIWQKLRRTGAEQEETTKVSRSELTRALVAWSAFVVAIALLSFIGFALSLGLLAAFLVIVLDRRSPWVGLGIAVGLAVGFYVVFVVALGVSLPVGALGF